MHNKIFSFSTLGKQFQILKNNKQETTLPAQALDPDDTQ